jgi:hypothetical protein
VALSFIKKYWHVVRPCYLMCSHCNYCFVMRWRAPKSRGETHLKVSQSQVAESWDLEARSRLSTLEWGIGSSWEPRD